MCNTVYDICSYDIVVKMEKCKPRYVGALLLNKISCSLQLGAKLFNPPTQMNSRVNVQF